MSRTSVTFKKRFCFPSADEDTLRCIECAH